MKRNNLKKCSLFISIIMLFNYFANFNIVEKNNYNYVYASEIEAYDSFQGWGAKLWGDENGFSDVNINYDNFMELKTNNSYITAYDGNIYRNEKKQNRIVMTFEVYTTDHTLLDHIYCGYVLKNGNIENDIYYKKAKVLDNTRVEGEYTSATMQLETDIESIGNFFLQIRLGKNDDYVSGQINVVKMSLKSDNDNSIIKLNSVSINNDSWSINNGVLKIKENLDDYNSDTYINRPWEKYKDIIWRLEFSDNVTAISSYCLYDMPNLRQIFFTDKITEIADNAFSNCSKLTAVSLVEGVNSVGAHAFSGCPLGYIYIPTSLKAENIQVNSFGDLNNNELKIYSDSKEIQDWCISCNIDFMPVLYGENVYKILSYDSFETTELVDKMIEYKSSNMNKWGMKAWSDSTNNKVYAYNNSLKMEITSENDSYVTAYNTVIYNNNIENKKIKIAVKAQSNKEDNLKHIYAGIVSIDENGNENDWRNNQQDYYKLGEIVEIYECNGVYNAVIEYEFTLDFIGDYFYQMRFGKNDDSVSGYVSVSSFEVTATSVANISDFSNWEHKEWWDDNGSAVTIEKDAIKLTAAKDGYATAYGKYNFSISENIISAKIRIKAKSNDKTALEKIYAGCYAHKDKPEFAEVCLKTIADIKELNSGIYKYEAELETVVDISSEPDYGLQIRLGTNSDRLSDEATVVISEVFIETSGVKVEVGNNPKFSAALVNEIDNSYFDINNAVDRSNLIFNLSTKHFLSTAYKQISNFNELKEVYIVSHIYTPEVYMNAERAVFDTNIRKNIYNYNTTEYLDATRFFLKSAKSQALYFGELHELSHNYLNQEFDNNYAHNVDDSEVNVRSFLAREVGFAYQNIPIYSDDGKLFYSDLVYHNEKNIFEACRALNPYESWFIYKEDKHQGYIHDLSFDVYLSLYKILENEEKGKGDRVFAEFMSGVTTDTDKLNEQLAYLFPEINIDFEALKDNAQKLLLCYNYLVSRTNSMSMVNLCKEYPYMSELIRKSLYCTNYDKFWEPISEENESIGSRDCICKFLGDLDREIYEYKDIYGEVKYDAGIDIFDCLMLRKYKKNENIYDYSCIDIDFDGKITEDDLTEITQESYAYILQKSPSIYNPSCGYCK